MHRKEYQNIVGGPFLIVYFGFLQSIFDSFYRFILVVITIDSLGQQIQKQIQVLTQMSINPHLKQPSDNIQLSQDSKDSVCQKSTASFIFQKYKLDAGCNHFPFKLYEFEESIGLQSCSEKSKKTRGCYRKYTLSQKLQAVEKIKNGVDVRKISEQYSIPRRNLLRWKKNGCDRKQGGGRPTDIQMETILFQKIKQNILSGQKSIRKEAMILSNCKGFKASKGWYTKFCRRQNIKFHQNSQIFKDENSQSPEQ